MQFDQLRRREFITLLGGAAAGWPIAVGAQPSERMRRIGVLMGLVASDSEAQSRVAAFENGLRELGGSRDTTSRSGIAGPETEVCCATTRLSCSPWGPT